MKRNEKKWYESKTLWTNTLLMAIGILSWAKGQVEAGLPLTLASFLNTALRLATKYKLRFK
jgi:hypothetical protein